MTAIIGFLEHVGASAVLRHATDAALQAAMEQVALDLPARAAILANDHAELAAITGSRVIASKVIAPTRHDDDDEEKDKEDKAPDRKEKQARSAAVHRAAIA